MEEFRADSCLLPCQSLGLQGWEGRVRGEWDSLLPPLPPSPFSLLLSMYSSLDLSLFKKKKNAFCVENKERGSFYFPILGQLDTGS